MRYWKLKDSTRVIGVDIECQMSSRWEEITKEEFELARVVSESSSPSISQNGIYSDNPNDDEGDK